VPFTPVPGPFLVLPLRLTLFAACGAYARARMLSRKKILRHGFFDSGADNRVDQEAAEVSSLRAPLECVLQLSQAVDPARESLKRLPKLAVLPTSGCIARSLANSSQDAGEFELPNKPCRKQQRAVKLRKLLVQAPQAR
jgi:hypothetical protein